MAISGARMVTAAETLFYFLMVGAAGLEPTTSCTPSKRASQAAPRPDRIGT